MSNSELMKCDITGSIVAFRNESLQIQAAIRSFMSATALRVQLAVIDNSPDDSLKEMVEREGAIYLWNGKNLGFGAGHNIGIDRFKNFAPYHLILNPDVTFQPDVLSTLYRFMESTPAAGAVMPRVHYPDGSEQHLCKLLPTPLDLIVRRFGSRIGESLFRDRMNRYMLAGADYSKSRYVPCLSGCFLLVRRAVLDRVGKFDERYFMYMEDVDLCRRIGEVSETMFFPEVWITHEYDKGSYRNPLLRNYHVRSATRYFKKWGWVFDPGRSKANRKALRRFFDR